MNKQQALELFGGTSALARALGITSQAVSKWPETLSQRQIDEINGAAIRLGLLNCESVKAAA